MPYKTQKIPLPRELDRRIKLTDSQRDEIREKYGQVAGRQLARDYGVSRSLIRFIGDPETYKRNLELREIRGGWRVYYDKKTHTKAIREHRQYKHCVLSMTKK